MNDSDVFQEVPPVELSKFIELMRDNSPHAYSFIRTLQNWKGKKRELPVSIVAPNGDPKLGIVFFFLFENVFIGSVYAHDNESVKELQDALVVTKKVPCLETKRTMFACLNEVAFKALNRLQLSPEWKLGSVYIDDRIKIFWLPFHRARKMGVEVPEGVEIRYLKKHHALLIDEHWPYRFNGSRKLIEMMIELNFGMGVFRGESLLSWVLLWYYGGIGSVETLECERSKGYGRCVVSAMSRRMGELGMDVYLCVVKDNEIGERFFKTLGFSFSSYCSWVVRTRT